MSEISRRAVLSTGGRAAVATLSLGGVGVAAPSLAGDDPLVLAVDAHRRLRDHAEAFGEALTAAVPMADEAQEEEFNRLCHEAAVDSWRLLDIEPASVAGVAAFLALVSDVALDVDLWPGRKDDDGKYVSFEVDAITYAAQALARLTGGQANV